MRYLSDYFVILTTKRDMIMRKSLIITIITFAATCSLVSCNNKDVYSEERHKELIHYVSPVDSVDQQHMWMLSQTKSLRYQVPTGTDYRELCVFTSNPLTDSEAELMSRIYVSAGQAGSLLLDVPYVQSTLYVALVDARGQYAVTAVPASQSMVNFAEVTTGRVVSSLKPQTYTFLFEENFPEPGDYDYNDLVLRVSQERTGEKQITVNVTISAVGAVRQLAGCIRLVGYPFEAIDSIRTTTGESFNDGVEPQILYFHKDTDFLIEGRNHEAVLNLFCDAHWAMAFNPSADFGLFQRKKYNTLTEITDNHQLRAPRTLHYVIYFKDGATLDNFTLNSLDPFIITDYNAGTWETHTEQFKTATVLYKYPVANFKDLPWALMVPQGDFQYPLEGQEIGYRKRTGSGVVAMFGAYAFIGHAFGEWAENHNAYLDWYLYPDTKLTFPF